MTRLVVLAPDGTLRSLDVSRLNKVTKANGYRLAPETPSMLSPSGQYLMFPQDGSVLVYTLRTGVWTTVHTGNAWTNDVTWLDRQLFLPSAAWSRHAGTVVRRARRATGDRFASRPGGLADARPLRGLRVAAGRPGQHGAELLPGPPASAPERHRLRTGDREHRHHRCRQRRSGGGRSGRWKNCCAAIGWLDDGTVVYESVGPVTRLIAWRVGTHDFGQVATITGVTAGREFYVSSWARMWASGSVG